MRVVVVYYSRKGTTEGLAGMVAEGFRKRGHLVEMVPIRHSKRLGFIQTGRASVTKRDMELVNEDSDYDLTEADVVVIGGPIFASNVNPYTRTYIQRARGLEGKPGGVFICCYSKAKMGRGLVDRLAEMAEEKGLRVMGRLVGSTSLREEYPRMADEFAGQVLEGLDH
ncbi:MAG: flavodoxin family protein [Thermoplasmata archaeon]|nr:MAG: flavodoxin family protein [Thermoplasmata archaeon]